MIKKGIIFITIVFIVGLALGFQIDPSPEKSILFAQYTIFFLLASVIIYYLPFKYKKYIIFLTIGFCAFYFGLHKYTKAMDTSSPEHIVHYLDKTKFGETTIKGIVTEDPDVRETYINLIVKPYEIKAEPPFGKSRKISKGKIIIRMSPSLKQYYTLDYADKIEIRGNFSPNVSANNPGTFNQQNFYIHQNIWGRMSVKDDRNIKLIGKEYPNKIIELSYKIKDKMLLTLKKTMRYPESAFLGGVTLGLRSGLSYEVQDEFRKTGISHVLAVSGLHVGFIYILLLSFFSLLKVPKQISAPIIIFLMALFVFITGARPATIRAALMVSILVIISSYIKGKFMNDLNVTLSIVALFYLIFINPLMLVEASFVMSFTAILSISLFASPISQMLKRYIKGYTFIAFILIAIILTIILIIPSLADMLFNKTYFLISFFLLSFILFKISFKLNQRNPGFNFGIASFGTFFIGFMGVQFGITLGNVLPISGIYFQRFAISGLYANWIAIPLIGIIVQLGIIAGILGFIYTPLALIVNAANYIFSKFFLIMAHFFAVYFPYPIIPKPSPFQIILYYFAICILIWYPKIKNAIKDFYYRLVLLWEKYELRKDLILLFSSLALIIIIGSSYVLQSFIPEDRLNVTFIDTKALGRFGNGNAYLLECPGDKNILINGGPGYFDFGNFILGMSVGETVIRPMLTSNRTTSLYGVIIQDLNPDCIGGLLSILQNFNIENIYSFYHMDQIANHIPQNIDWWNNVDEYNYIRYKKELLKAGVLNLSSSDKNNIKELIKASSLKSDTKSILIKNLILKNTSKKYSLKIMNTIDQIRSKRLNEESQYLEMITQILSEPGLKNKKNTLRIIGKIAQVIKKKKINCIKVSKGSDIVINSDTKIKILSPSANMNSENYSDKILILMVKYKKKKILFTGNASGKVINQLMNEYNNDLKCNILSVPNYGSVESNPYSFIKMTDPEWAVCHYYYKPKRYFNKDIYLNYHCHGVKFYKTDDEGAIVFTIKNNKIQKKKWISKSITRYKTSKKYIKNTSFKNKKKLLKFSTIDIGIGNAYLIQTPDNKNYLINSGRYGEREISSDAGKGIIIPFLKKRKINNLDGIFIANSIDENIGGLISILSSISSKKIYQGITANTPLKNQILNIAAVNNTPIHILENNETIQLGNNIKCIVLNAQAPKGSDNVQKDSSLVLKIIYKNFSLLITGNISGNDYMSDKKPSPGSTEYFLLKNKKNLIKSTVMTIPDSASKNSSTYLFLKSIDPQYAILNINKYDRYNPSEDILYNYQKINSQIYRTDYDGNIYLYTDGKKIQFETDEK